MKFIPLSSARSLQIDEPVYTKNSDGQYGLGKLIKVEKTKNGTVHTFENVTTPDEVSKPVTNIVSVAIIKRQRNGTN